MNWVKPFRGDSPSLNLMCSFSASSALDPMSFEQALIAGNCFSMSFSNFSQWYSSASRIISGWFLETVSNKGPASFWSPLSCQEISPDYWGQPRQNTISYRICSWKDISSSVIWSVGSFIRSSIISRYTWLKSSEVFWNKHKYLEPFINELYFGCENYHQFLHFFLKFFQKSHFLRELHDLQF